MKLKVLKDFEITPQRIRVEGKKLVMGMATQFGLENV